MVRVPPQEGTQRWLFLSFFFPFYFVAFPLRSVTDPPAAFAQAD